MELTAEGFEQGMSTQEYFGRIKVNKEAILEVYDAVEPPQDDRAFFDGLPQPLRLAVFTEAWCGDALTSTPTILRLAEATDGLDVRIFERDQHLELANSFLPEHRHGTLPLFIVYDAQMREVSRFIETAGELVPAVNSMEEEIRRAKVAASEIDKPLRDMSEPSQSAFRMGRTAYRVAHAREWGQVVADAFTALVRAGLALAPGKRPAVGGTRWPQE
jgi:hypothetical protein